MRYIFISIVILFSKINKNDVNSINASKLTLSCILLIKISKNQINHWTIILNKRIRSIYLYFNNDSKIIFN